MCYSKAENTLSLCMKVTHIGYTPLLVYTAVSLAWMSWLSFSITVERSGLLSSDFWSMFVILMLVGAQDFSGLSGSAFGLYPFAFLFLAMLL